MSDLIYTHQLSPFLFEVQLFGQTIGLRWYGLAYVAGFALAFWYFRSAARRQMMHGLDERAVEQLIFASAGGVLLGGRLGFILQHPGEIISDPLFVLRVWDGGMTFFGGLIGVLLAVWWVARRHGVSFWRLTDIATFPAALGLGLGRIANFINAELVGWPTGGNWGVVFPQVDSLPRHPSQLYEAASHFLLFGILVLAARLFAQWRRERVGRLSFLFLAGYGLLRFGTDFFRADDTFFGPFSTGQWASLLVALVGCIGLFWLRRPGSAPARAADECGDAEKFPYHHRRRPEYETVVSPPAEARLLEG